MITLLAMAVWLGMMGLVTPSARADEMPTPVTAPEIGALPLDGPVVQDFNPPAEPWLAGHRGIDIAGEPGALVRSPLPGTVYWVGTIAEVPMMSVAHDDGTRSTYQPITTVLRPGMIVHAGQVLGVLQEGHCAPHQACLHFGVKSGDTYDDPLRWIRHGTINRVRLLPSHATVRAPPATGFDWDGTLPVPGPITSGFGDRVNPLSGAPEFHDGVDIGAACGTPVTTILAGQVTFAGQAGGYGNRIEIDHGMVDGHHRVSSYSHLQSFAVPVGASVHPGDIVALVGSTGFSTGCHVHWSIQVDGVMVNPLGG